MTMAEKKEAERLRYEGRWKFVGYFDACAVEKERGQIMKRSLAESGEIRSLGQKLL